MLRNAYCQFIIQTAVHKGRVVASKKEDAVVFDIQTIKGHTRKIMSENVLFAEVI